MAVRDVSFTLKSGQILACVGPNAAGKTTLLNIISGWYRPDDGSVRINGHEIDSFTPEIFAAYGVVRTYQRARLFRKQTVLDNLLLASRRHSEETLLAAIFRKSWLLREKQESDRAKKILVELGISELCDRPAKFLSGGEQRLVELAIAGMRRPKILVLDEPAANLSQEARQKIAAYLLKQKQEGICCILVEHDLGFVSAVADEVIVLSRGMIVGPAEPTHERTQCSLDQAYDDSELPIVEPKLFDEDAASNGERHFKSGSLFTRVYRRFIQSRSLISRASDFVNPARALFGVWQSNGRRSSFEANREEKSAEEYEALTVHGLTVDYGSGPVIQEVSFNINPGEIVALTGGNGAGKSTTIRAILGLLPYRGAITLGSKSLTSLPAYVISRVGISYVAQHRKVFPSLTVLENLLIAQEGRRNLSGLEPALRAFPELSNLLYSSAGTLSGGQQQIVAIARVLLQKPKMLLLDEPSAGLSDPVWKRSVEVFTQLSKSGVPILIVEHRPMALKDILSRAYVIESGRLLNM